MTYLSTKLFGPFSAAFRQHSAEHSHCRFVHGYGLQIKLTFEADTLDSRNWVVDFGGLKSFKAALEEVFDHKLVVASDDPHVGALTALDDIGLAQVVILPAVGCEAFAEYVHLMATEWLDQADMAGRVRVRSVEVMEHAFNSAIYKGQ